MSGSSAAYNKKYKTKRRKLIADIKTELGCADCGFDKWPEALDFDHISDDKDFNISTSLLLSLPKVMAEIAKCEVVCANCHRHRTQARRNSELREGV